MALAFLVAIPLNWSSLFPKDAFALTQRDDYLASLNLTVETGCILLPRVKPKILFAGDSHVYSGIDFLYAGTRFGSDEVGACTFAGGFFEHYALLLRYLRQVNAVPVVLVLGVSLRQFTEGPTKDSRRKQVERLLFDAEYRDARLKTWAKNLDDGKPAFGRTAEQLRTALARHTEPILQLDPKTIALIMSRGTDARAAKWQKEIPSWTFTEDIEDAIDRFCREVRSMGIDLVVVHIPESPYVERIYTQRQIGQYRTLLKRLDRCARSVIFKPAQAWGLDERFFVNRMLVDDFKYDALNTKVPDTEVDNFIDLDHLNGVGANLFTKRLLDDLPVKISAH